VFKIRVELKISKVKIMARILVIDDEELARITLRKILVGAGHVVVEAENGDEGLTAQRESPCDLVITDMIMPVKEGVETISDLKQEFPNVRIIAMSGGGRTRNLNYLEIAKVVGGDKILAKPFSVTELLDCVNLVLEGSK
jgi:CheY-like chemotaxis protein